MQQCPGQGMSESYLSKCYVHAVCRWKSGEGEEYFTEYSGWGKIQHKRGSSEQKIYLDNAEWQHLFSSFWLIKETVGWKRRSGRSMARGQYSLPTIFKHIGFDPLLDLKFSALFRHGFVQGFCIKTHCYEQFKTIYNYRNTPLYIFEVSKVRVKYVSSAFIGIHIMKVPDITL